MKAGTRNRIIRLMRLQQIPSGTCWEQDDIDTFIQMNYECLKYLTNCDERQDAADEFDAWVQDFEDWIRTRKKGG